MDAIARFPHVSAPQHQRWFLTGLIALLVAVSIPYALKISGDNDHRSAFLRWRPTLLQLGTSTHFYEESGYPNPPIMALLLQPLAILPPVVGSLAWYYLKVAMAVLIFQWAFRLAESPDRPFPVWGKALATALSLRPVLGDLMHGNVNILIVFLVMAALILFRGRRDVAAGVILALAIACKVTPALFVPYFLWKRAGRLLGGCLAGLVLWLWLVPGLCLGFSHNQHQLQTWCQQMIAPYLVQGRVATEHQNQSLPAVVMRLLTHSPSFSEWDETSESQQPLAYHNLFNLDPVLAGLFTKLCMAAFAGAVVLTCRTSTTPRRNGQLAAEYALVILGMLLFSERTWKHHCVALIVPIGVIVYALRAYYRAIRRPSRTRKRRRPESLAHASGSYSVACASGSAMLLITTLVVVTLLIGSTSAGLFGRDDSGLGKLAQVYGGYMWANLLLVGALCFLLRNPNLTPARPVPGADAPTCPDLPEECITDDQPTEGLCHTHHS